MGFNSGLKGLMIMALGFSVNACPDCPATGIAFSVPLLRRLF
jgi:hypothetical protein